MIYVDTSVLLAYLLAEDRQPPSSLWDEQLISSRLVEYEMWTRIHALRLFPSHGEDVHQLIGRLALLELAPTVLARALEPFPMPVRTLDALHLASVEFVLEGIDAAWRLWEVPSSGASTRRSRPSLRRSRPRRRGIENAISAAVYDE